MTKGGLRDVNFQCRALLFDMDGVLVDSTAHVDAVWREWARRRGVDENRVIEIAHGRTTAAVLAAVAPEFATPEEIAGLEERDAQHETGIIAIVGALELLGILPEQSWAIVTSATASLARRRIAGAGIPEPSVLVTADDVGDGKPSPEGYLTAARLLGRKPAECIVFEDAPAGIAAARAAGMDVIAVATTFATEELSHADAVIESMEHIDVAVRDGRMQVQVAPLR